MKTVQTAKKYDLLTVLTALRNKIAEAENALAEGPLTFEVKGFQDKLGNTSTEVLTTANHYKYSGVTYDRTKPAFVEESNIKVKDTSDTTIKVYKDGSDTPVAEVNAKEVDLEAYEAGLYKVVITDADIDGKVEKDNGKKIDPSCWKFALKISIPYIPHLLSLSLLHSTNKMMITKMCGKEQNACPAVF